MTRYSPFPLEGGRVGDGGGAVLRPIMAREALSHRWRRSPSMSFSKHSASTPTQPSPLEGEGSRVRAPCP